MMLPEIEEAVDIIKNINGLLLLFSSTNKTAELVEGYLQELIRNIEEQGLPDEAVDDETMQKSLQDQLTFLKQLLSNVQELLNKTEPTDKELN